MHTHRQIYILLVRMIARQIDRRMDKQIDRWMDRQMDGQIDGWIYRWTDRQIDTQIHSLFAIFYPDLTTRVCTAQIVYLIDRYQRISTLHPYSLLKVRFSIYLYLYLFIQLYLFISLSIHLSNYLSYTITIPNVF